MRVSKGRPCMCTCGRKRVERVLFQTIYAFYGTGHSQRTMNLHETAGCGELWCSQGQATTRQRLSRRAGPRQQAIEEHKEFVARELPSLVVRPRVAS